MSDDQFMQLKNAIQAMDKRFDAMEKKFEDQFTGLYKYASKEFNKIHKRLDKTAAKDELNTYANAVDTHIKRTETYHQEMDVLGHKVDRHEKWHHKTTKAVGIKLSA